MVVCHGLDGPLRWSGGLPSFEETGETIPVAPFAEEKAFFLELRAALFRGVVTVGVVQAELVVVGRPILAYRLMSLALGRLTRKVLGVECRAALTIVVILIPQGPSVCPGVRSEVPEVSK